MSNQAQEIQKPLIAVIIPAYKAEQHIRNVIKNVPTFVNKIFVVDDCSPDSTSNIVEEICLENEKVQLIKLDKNQGVGGATLVGLKEAADQKYDILVKMDSDGQMNVDYLLPLLLPILNGTADYTKGNRFLHRNELKSMPILRLFGNFGLSCLTKLASGHWNVFDPTNGYIAIHSSIFVQLNPANIAKRFFFESSMLIELGIIGASVKDIAIPALYAEEESNLSEWDAFIKFPPQLFRGFLKRIVIVYFLKDFGLFSLYFPTGICLLFFGFVFGLYHWLWAHQPNQATPTGTIMIAAMSILVGLQLVLNALSLDLQNCQRTPLSKNLTDSDNWKKVYS